MIESTDPWFKSKTPISVAFYGTHGDTEGLFFYNPGPHGEKLTNHVWSWGI